MASWTGKIDELHVTRAIDELKFRTKDQEGALHPLTTWKNGGIIPVYLKSRQTATETESSCVFHMEIPPVEMLHGTERSPRLNCCGHGVPMFNRTYTLS